MQTYWRITEWKKKRRFEEADQACKHACGLGLEEAYTVTRGCYVDGTFMSPFTIAEAIASLFFDFTPYSVWEQAMRDEHAN